MFQKEVGIEKTQKVENLGDLKMVEDADNNKDSYYTETCCTSEDSAINDKELGKI